MCTAELRDPNQALFSSKDKRKKFECHLRHFLSGALRVNIADQRFINVSLKKVLCCSGPGCSKLTTSLVNVSLKFQTLISELCQYFLLK